MEEVKIIEKLIILNCSDQLCTPANDKYYDGVPLHSGLVKLFQVDEDLKHCLPSPRACLNFQKVARVVMGPLDIQKRTMMTNH